MQIEPNEIKLDVDKLEVFKRYPFWGGKILAPFLRFCPVILDQHYFFLAKIDVRNTPKSRPDGRFIKKANVRL